MIKLTYDKEYYHLQWDMHKWCEENVGKGGWNYRADLEEGEDQHWSISSAFGRSTFVFRHAEDAVAFKLVWG